MSSVYGTNLHISIFGQSHSDAIGVAVDGIPSGKKIDTEELMYFMQRRSPGRNEYSSKRNEADIPEIISGLFNGYTCGAPLAAVIRNSDQRSSDYEAIKYTPRPGHADLTAQLKYKGFQDYTGGGHFSGRLTAPMCIAGGICIQLLREEGIEIASHIYSIADIKDSMLDPVDITDEDLDEMRGNSFPVLDEEIGLEMQTVIARAGSEGESLGGVVECVALGLPAGIGSPMFGSLESRIAQIIFGIPAVKGIEFGNGFQAAALTGSENNDAYYYEGDEIKTETNNHGGILGGISSGMPLIFRVAFKPTPSIANTQRTVDLRTKEDTENIME